MSHIVTIAGSPCANAKSTAVLEFAQRLLKRHGVHTNAILLRNLPAEDLLFARAESLPIQAARCILDQAEGIVLATPVYKAAYSGILKTFLDLLPQYALAGKTILPIATGGSASHLLALDYALNPVLSALGASHILRGVYLTDVQIQFEHGGVLHLEENVEQRLSDSLLELIAAVHPPVARPKSSTPRIACQKNAYVHALPSESELLLEGFER